MPVAEFVDPVTFRSREGSWDERLITFADLKRRSLRAEMRGVSDKSGIRVSVLLAFANLVLCLFIGKTTESALLLPNFKEIDVFEPATYCKILSS